MAFLDEMKGRFVQVSQTAVQKTKDITEIARLNGIISENERKISEMYTEIGFDIYKIYAEKPMPEVKEKIEQVKELHYGIEMCKERIKNLNNMNLCPTCGAKVSKTMLFCSECGNKLLTQEVASENKCKQCGEVLAEGMAFCTACGTKVE